MKGTKDAMREIARLVGEASTKLDKEQVDTFLKTLLETKRVFVMGAGRSGLVAKAFAMRLMQLGIDAHVIGETTTPSLKGGDLLFTISGSGETDLVVSAAQISKKAGAKVGVLTSYPRSSLAKLADLVIVVPGRTKTETTTDFVERELLGEYAPVVPLGTLFEITAMVFLDGVTAALMSALGKKEEDLRARHATIG